MPRKKKTVQEASIPEVKSELASKIEALEIKDDSVVEALEERIKQYYEEKEKKEAEREMVETEKEEKQEKLTLAYLINETCKFVRKKISLEEFNNLGEQIDVLGYIPILSKMRIVMSFIYDLQHSDSEVHELKIVEIQKKLFFEVLLKEYAGIDISDNSLINYSSYDLLYPVFYPYIIQYCEADYNTIIKMIDDSLNLYNLRDLSEILENADYQKIEARLKRESEMFNFLTQNKELVKDLKDLMINSNPNAKDYNDLINLTANAEAMNSLLEKKEN